MLIRTEFSVLVLHEQGYSAQTDAAHNWQPQPSIILCVRVTVAPLPSSSPAQGVISCLTLPDSDALIGDGRIG
jgi:hypothetical protein